MAAGFFTVLIVERLVLNCRERRGARQEREPLLHGHGHGHGPVTDRSPDLEGSAHHVHVDLQAHSPFRSFMLFLSLSLHSVFEGLAIGLQNTDSKVRPSGRCRNLLTFAKNITLRSPSCFFCYNSHVLVSGYCVYCRDRGFRP